MTQRDCRVWLKGWGDNTKAAIIKMEDQNGDLVPCFVTQTDIVNIYTGEDFCYKFENFQTVKVGQVEND